MLCSVEQLASLGIGAFIGANLSQLLACLEAGFLLSKIESLEDSDGY